MNPAPEPNNDPTLIPQSPRSTAPTLGGDDLPTISYVEQPAARDAVTVRRNFGDYEVLEEIGRGGMGVVYKARHKSLDRIVALKMILPGPLAQPDDLARFKTEAEAAARLQHPAIVAVHDIGQVEGQHFFSMDYIDGPSLSQLLRHGPLPCQTAARYLLTIARAIHHAHRHDILHRDLKPSNLLLDSADQPHVTDFGLAKKLGGDSGQTHTGAVLGTPSYMAPEQAAGKIKTLGPACDIYALGAVLYELITGRPPFRAETPMDTLQQVLESEPVPPREINPRVDKDLETICLKCLQKDPGLRYPSADALADDLQRYLNGEAISARSLNVLDRLVRTLDRSQVAAEFRQWEWMLLIVAAIIFVGHTAKFILLHTNQPRLMHWVVRAFQFGLIGLTFWRFRKRTLLPTSAAERQLWTIWIGYLLAYVITALVVRELAGKERWDDLVIYPFSSVLAGMGFFAMGSSYWGRCYLFGLGFFGLAALMPLRMDWAPLVLGLLWALALGLIALHVRQVGGEAVESAEQRARRT